MKTSIIDAIKDKISCPDYMQREHAAKIISGRCKSFRPDAHNNSSLMVNPRDWYDFGSGIGGDIIDLCAHDKFNGDKGSAIRYLAENWGLKETSYTPQIDIVFNSYLKILDLATEFYHNSLKPCHINYLHGRGLTDDTINNLRIGWSDNPCDFIKSKGFTQEQINDSGITQFINRLMVPYLRNGKATYLIGRASVWDDMPSGNPDAKYTKLFRSELSEHPIWGRDTLTRPGTVIVAEGIFDAISCWQENYPVITAVTGAFSAEQKKDLFPALKNRDVIVCMDYDPETHAGQKFTTTLANELFEHGIHVSACYLKGTENKIDLSQLYAGKPCRDTLESAFAQAKEWSWIRIIEISNILQENEKRAELASFLRRCAKSFDWPTVAQLVENAKKTEAFEAVWLKELKDQLKKAPPELDIVAEFKQKFDCIFHETLGWYEYSGSVWKRISEFIIKQKISNLYGKHATAKNVEAVFKLLKSELIRTELFNQYKDLINFPNGMLNIETGEMLPHGRDYYSSIQMSYPYDPKAECKEWMKFIEDITDGDRQRHDLLQEMFGYCLTKDVRYQKCFCLIGTGANGKSVLLQLLESMIGEENTSHVEIAYLQSDFQRIGLLSSMVNICNDMKSDVTGTDAFFKAIVAGDPITACYKGKDFVNFKPFCKMVFSANRMITTKEVDYSILRRFCFLNFPITFVDTVSDPAKEKAKIPHIEGFLLKELPGIFNWAMTGLKELRKQGAFTQTPDQKQMEYDMSSINNPLLGFVEDVVGCGAEHWQSDLSRQEVYKAYTSWCMETNTHPLSSRSFWPRLRLLYPFEEKKITGNRFIRFKKEKYV